VGKGIILAKKLDVNGLNARFEKEQPEAILKWAIAEFPSKIAMTSSFQSESVGLLHMVSKIDPNVPVLFLETGFHFKETHEFKKKVIALLGLKHVIDLRADPKRREALMKKHQDEPYQHDPDLCCQINKVEPLDLALQSYDAWVSGIRRSQSKTRQDVSIVEEYEEKGHTMYKINPLANWTSGDVRWYNDQHKLPKHELTAKGYLSIGCWPCTRPAQPGDDERSGRWAGREKTECGIHTFKAKKVKEKKSEEIKEEGSDI